MGCKIIFAVLFVLLYEDLSEDILNKQIIGTVFGAHACINPSDYCQD